jgi:choline dehydrogenase-like flavoprotein
MALPQLFPLGFPVDAPQKTSLGLDVVPRFICNTWEEATQDPAGIDVVVLGAGLFGGYCASKIYELSRARFRRDGLTDRQAALRVLVLEAGPFVVSQHTQNIPNLGLFDPGIFNTTSTGSGGDPGTRNLVWGVGWRSNQPFVGQAYCVGGKGVFWGGWCPRLQANDLKEWPAEVRSFLTTVNPARPVGFRPIDHIDATTGKRLKRNDPLGGYEAIEYEMGVAPSDDFVFDPANISQDSATQVGLNEVIRVFFEKSKTAIDKRITQVQAAPIAVQTQSFISGLFALDKYSSVPALTSATRSDHGDGRREDLRMSVVPFTHVVRLECASGGLESPVVGTRLVERIVVNVDGQERVLAIGSHCQVVLAMSCIESTRLALESFSLESSLLKPQGQELMGRNFMVHLRADIAFKVERSKFAKFVAATWPGKKLADILQLASVHVQCEGTHGTYQYQLYAATNGGGPDANMYKLVPDLEVQRQIAAGFDDDSISIVLRASGEVKGGRKAALRDPNFDFIDLAGDQDFDRQFGHRRAWVQFRTAGGQDHSADAIWQDMHDTGHAIARALANGGTLEYTQVNGSADFQLTALSRQQGVGTTFHDSGTLWMGENPDDSVTDVNGHFHHVTNAYCADQALFTTIGSANPALTGMCLAHKVAEDIVSRHGQYVVPPSDVAGFTSVSLKSSRGWLTAPYNGITPIGDGEIVEMNPSQGIGLYFLPELFRDFDLFIEWKAFRAPKFPNSGVLLRLPDPRNVNFGNQNEFDAFYDQAVEVQIDDLGKNFVRGRNPASIFGDSRHKTGAIYGVAPATQWAGTVLAPDGPATVERYWNAYQIKAKGTSITVRLNGKIVCDAVLPSSKRLDGFMGLQFHTGRVQFRNLRIRKIN